MASFMASVVSCCTTSIMALRRTLAFLVGLYGAVHYGLYGGLSGGFYGAFYDGLYNGL